MRTRFYFIGGIGIVVAALVGLISSLGIFRAIENLVTHDETVVAVVSEEDVRVHEGPSRDDPVKGLLQEGEEVRVISRQGAWLKVKSREENESGWIRGNTVVRAESQQENEKGPPRAG